MPNWAILILFIIGFPIIIGVLKRPSLFWPMLIIANMIGNGPRTFGYVFLDEYYTLCILIGALIRIAVQRGPAEKRNILSGEKAVFILWALYMTVHSMIGMIVLHDIRIMRWLIFFTMLALLMVLVRRKDFAPPSFRQISILILFGAFMNFSLYLAQGLYFEKILKMGTYGRFENQDYFWSGSAYAMFPILLGLPAALFLIRDHSRRVRIWAWLTIFLSLVTSYYFQSRVGFGAIVLFLVLGYRQIGFKRFSVAFLLFLLVFFVSSKRPFQEAGYYVSQLIDSTQVLTNSSDNSNKFRNLMLKASVLTAADNWITLFTGSGFYTHRYLIVPHMRELQNKFVQKEYIRTSLLGRRGKPLSTEIGTIYRTSTFPALLIDTGLFGLILFSANFLLLGRKILSRKEKQKWIFLMVLFLSYMWMFVVNITDIILFYLILMPGGLLDLWSRGHPVENTRILMFRKSRSLANPS